MHTILKTFTGTAQKSFAFPIRSLSSQNDAATIIQGPSLLTGTSVHRPSPSIFFLPGLRSLPFWTSPSSTSNLSVAYGDPIVTEVVQHLENNYKIIKQEYMSSVLGIGTNTDLSSSKSKVNKPIQPDYDVNLKGGEHSSDSLHIGSWDWHSFILNGEVQPQFMEAFPQTANILNGIGDHLFYSSSNDFHNPFGFTFFSTLHGKSYIKPHTGPMNLRLRIHLPLIVPSNTKTDAYSVKPKTKCGIRVGDQIREWKEGKAVVLDDSYEHEVWNETNETRVILLVDIWHPDVREQERHRIGKMFRHALEKGWIKGR